MAANTQSVRARQANPKLNSYRVKIGVADSGEFYTSTTRARNPVEALMKAMNRLGLGETPSTPFAAFVTPKTAGS